ncbi:MAG: hypothetical protein F6K16_09090 [Symploca sp. SIO2B6]|nr:hypothetical protein [Symploca sp. SIO2B6]
MPKPTLVAALSIFAITLTLIFLHPAVEAQTDPQVSLRLSRIENDYRNLRSQVQQLETQLNRIGRTTGDTTIYVQPIQTDPNELPETSNSSVPETSLMFDQLATLVIETRQDMLALQAQVNDLAQIIENFDQKDR